MMKDIAESLEKLFIKNFGEVVENITPIPQGGSDRKYFRITSASHSAIGAYNPDVEENRTFFYLTKHFTKKGFAVPLLYNISDNELFYLQSDLGNTSLFELISDTCWNNEGSFKKKETLKVVLGELCKIQVQGANGLNFEKCYPKAAFDRQSVMWDFNYFKYSFLKPSGAKFNEAKLDDDFERFTTLLLSEPAHYFQYRDFQSRNIMMVGQKPHFIDYQGGRKGPLLYDLASFLYQAKANFTPLLRNDLCDYYLQQVARIVAIDIERSKQIFPLFALFRVIQTLGAYGYRGFFERKAHFLQSIPLAASNLMGLLENSNIELIKLPTLRPLLETIHNEFGLPSEQTVAFDGLTLEVNSFSLVKGYPMEHPEHGGGFVFDCRSLYNPGRQPELRTLTGFDKPVIDLLNAQTDAQQFFTSVFDIVSNAIESYSHRGFKHLSVSFGCTGGQHRSVYMANRLANHFLNYPKIRVVLKHRELNR